MTEFRIVVNAIITCQGEILLGKKEEKEGHPISGEWHFPGGHLEEGEEPEEAVKREVKEETGVEVEVHQIVDAVAGTYTDMEVPFQIIYHCESSGRNANALDDLEEVKWVNPTNVIEELGETEARKIESRRRLKDFIKRIEKAPF